MFRMTRMDLTRDPYAETMKKIDVAGRPVRGNPNAKITIINYDDFECPFCARLHQTLFPQILKEYGVLKDAHGIGVDIKGSGYSLI